MIKSENVWPFFFLCLTLAGMPLEVRAAKRTLTLAEAVKIIVEEDPEIQKTKQDYLVANAQLKRAFGSALPAVSATGSWLEKKDSLLGAGPLFGGEPYNHYQLGVELRQPLFRGGALIQGYLAAHSLKEMREVEVDLKVRDGVLKTVRTFYELIYEQKNLQFLLETKDLQGRLSQVSELRFKRGTAEKLEWLQARTELALIEPEIAQSRNRLKIKATDLLNQLNQSEIDQLEIAGDFKTLKREEILKYIEGKERLELKRTLLELEELEARRKAELSVHWPTVDFVALAGRAGTKSTQLFDSDSNAWSFGLELRIPLFSGLTGVFEREKVRAEVKRVEIESERLRNQHRVDTFSSEKELENSFELMDSSQAALVLAEDSMREAERNFRLGRARFPDLVTTQAQLIKAKQSSLKNQLNIVNRLADLYLAKGWSTSELVDLLKN